MQFLFQLLGDALLFTALSWFAGYGALGPAMGLRLTLSAKLRLFAEVFAITSAALYVFITLDGIMGWVETPPWPGSPAPHRLVAIAALLTVGFLYTRRRSQALGAPPAGTQPDDDRSNAP